MLGYDFSNPIVEEAKREILGEGEFCYKVKVKAGDSNYKVSYKTKESDPDFMRLFEL